MEKASQSKFDKCKKNICAGIMAHVDAGKTTLSEALLFKTGAIKKQGRVDHGDTFLDTDIRERSRGITIFSKQAEIRYKDMRLMMLDTPGHVDFSAEMERTLQVLDYGLLVISGKEGVQGHTLTLWKLLKKHDIPVFIFINKMDLEGAEREKILEELKKDLDQSCIDFSSTGDDATLEQIAMCHEELLEQFLDSGGIESEAIGRCIKERKLFPCFFGSALRLQGIETLLDAMAEFCRPDTYPGDFGARVYKITRDSHGSRLTHLKITGGQLHTKAMLKDEKVEQIRIYSGAKFRNTEVAEAGDICAVTGLKGTYAGQGLGFEKDAGDSLLESALVYKVDVLSDHDVHDALTKLKLLEEEDPQLHVVWNEQLQEIQMRLMGQVQTEILKDVIKERFGIYVDFGHGSVSYRETIAEPVVGGGHFEPLRHYAEVHLLLEPAERGSGLSFYSSCSEDVLHKNWQRLILTHLAEKEHIGVLTGSPITDMKITLLTGRAHLKHTEGGDFRQATYRALRQGLRKAESILLEPWYEFRLRLPADMIGRAMSDIQRMGGIIDEPENISGTALLHGRAPVSQMKDYPIEVASYTKGRGHLSCTVCGYEQCSQDKEVIDAIGYDPDKDMENTADSVFCSHGAGFTVRWDEVDTHLHMESHNPYEEEDTEPVKRAGGFASPYRGTREEERQLDKIFEMTYGKPKQRTFIQKREILSSQEKIKIKPAKVLEEYLLVDGYNIIFAWPELKELAKINMDSARQSLIEILENYQGYRKCHVIAVFDAYRVKGGERHYEKHGNVDVIYTQEAETADMYIEKAAHEKSREYHVRVATSDRLEQIIITGGGAFKVSADEFRAEVEQLNMEISRVIESLNMKNRREGRNKIEIKT